MRKDKLYLDTTIPNYVFNSHIPDKQKAAIELFKCIKNGMYEGYISDVVIRELVATQDVELRNKLLRVIEGLPLFEVTEECIILRQEYINRGVIPAENRDDALHVAVSSVYEVDFLVSYNFEHIVKIKTIDKITAINLLLGYKTPRIVIPEEVINP